MYSHVRIYLCMYMYLSVETKECFTTVLSHIMCSMMCMNSYAYILLCKINVFHLPFLHSSLLLSCHGTEPWTELWALYFTVGETDWRDWISPKQPSTLHPTGRQVLGCDYWRWEKVKSLRYCNSGSGKWGSEREQRHEDCLREQVYNPALCIHVGGRK